MLLGHIDLAFCSGEAWDVSQYFLCLPLKRTCNEGTRKQVTPATGTVPVLGMESLWRTEFEHSRPKITVGFRSTSWKARFREPVCSFVSLISPFMTFHLLLFGIFVGAFFAVSVATQLWLRESDAQSPCCFQKSIQSPNLRKPTERTAPIF